MLRGARYDMTLHFVILLTVLYAMLSCPGLYHAAGQSMVSACCIAALTIHSVRP